MLWGLLGSSRCASGMATYDHCLVCGNEYYWQRGREAVHMNVLASTYRASTTAWQSTCTLKAQALKARSPLTSGERQLS